MQTVALGQQGLKVSRIGLGCMGMSWAYGEADEVQALATLQESLDLGVTFWDTADIYAEGKNETLLGQILKTDRDRVVIATKCGITGRNSEGYTLNGRPKYIYQSCDHSLKRLGVDTIDLYYLHRLDPDVPVEESIGAIGELVRRGKVRFAGLSEVSADIVRRAHGEFPLSALQSEYSLFSRGVEKEVLPTLRELKIGLVPYCPLGRGLLTGAINQQTEFGSEDFRSKQPRFQSENLTRNLRLVERVKVVAKEHGCTPAQFALAWLLAQGRDIVPIPGTKRPKYLRENAEATSVEVSSASLAEVDFDSNEVAGTRHTRLHMKSLAP